MGVLLGGSHAATMLDLVDHVPMAFPTYAATQTVTERSRWVPDLPAHFVRGKDWCPGHPPSLPQPDPEEPR